MGLHLNCGTINEHTWVPGVHVQTHTLTRTQCHSCGRGTWQTAGAGAVCSLIKGDLCFAASSRGKMSVLLSQLPLHSPSQTERLAVPRGRSLGPAVPEAPANGPFPLFLLQSARTREVHQVSMWATPLLPPVRVLCPELIPVASPPSGPVSVPGILGRFPATRSRPVQDSPHPASSAGLPPSTPSWST